MTQTIGFEPVVAASVEEFRADLRANGLEPNESSVQIGEIEATTFAVSRDYLAGAYHSLLEGRELVSRFGGTLAHGEFTYIPSPRPFVVFVAAEEEDSEALAIADDLLASCRSSSE